MTIEVPNVPYEVLLDHRSHAESSASVRERVCAARSAHRILKVARTIADLEPRYDIQATHLTEAISYRRLERPAR